MKGGESQRKSEIQQHWKEKGQRLVELEPGVWVDLKAWVWEDSK